MTKTKSITAYKGFNKDFKCRGYQFEVGKTYEHDSLVSMCNSGFHACENPFDVWAYYGPFESRFAVVELSGTSAKKKSDSKIVAAKIEIKAELSLPEFINRAVDWIIDACKTKNESGYSARIGSSGYSARIGSSGYYARIGSSGDSARIGSSGDSARIGSSGDSARIGSSGDSAQIGSSGDSAQIGSSGDYAQIGSGGDSARIGSSGDSARIVADGKDSVIASAGNSTTARGAKGTWISLAEFDDDGKCVGFATGCIGKSKLKPDTNYIAKDGKLVGQ